MQLLFSFDQAMKVEKTLMETFACLQILFQNRTDFTLKSLLGNLFTPPPPIYYLPHTNGIRTMHNGYEFFRRSGKTSDQKVRICTNQKGPRYCTTGRGR
jgi:hypothetical protein